MCGYATVLSTVRIELISRCTSVLRLAVAGIGHVGKLHLFNLSKLENVEVVGVADRNRKNQALAHRLGVKQVYADYHELFEKAKVDAAVISLPNFLHADSVIFASENGIDVMVDKPLARSVAEAKNIVSTTARQGTRLFVSTNFRYFPHVQKLKKEVHEGSIGDVVLATIEHVMHGPFSHPLYPKPVPDWWFDRDQVGGGALMDNGYHCLDLFTWMFGECQVEAAQLGHMFNLDQEDTATVIVKSKSGTQGVINAGWFSHVVFPRLDFRIVAHGTSGFLNTDELRPASLYLHAAKEAIRNLGRRLIGKPLNLLSYTYYFESYVTAVKTFVNCLRTGTAFPVSLDQQIHVLDCIEEAYRRGNG